MRITIEINDPEHIELFRKDVSRIMGVTNPSDKDVKDWIRDSITSLLGSVIEELEVAYKSS